MSAIDQRINNVWILDQEVDVLWAEQRLAVELDSRGFHQTRAAFERDGSGTHRSSSPAFACFA